MTDRELMSKAKQASLNAYVPYSRFAVGAAIECTTALFSPAAMLKTPPSAALSAPSAPPAARRSARVTGTSGASPSMPTAKTGVPLRRMPPVSGGVFTGDGGALRQGR